MVSRRAIALFANRSKPVKEPGPITHFHLPDERALPGRIGVLELMRIGYDAVGTNDFAELATKTQQENAIRGLGLLPTRFGNTAP